MVFISMLLLFFFTEAATTENYTYCHTLSLHDALPISAPHPIVKHEPSFNLEYDSVVFCLPVVRKCHDAGGADTKGGRRGSHGSAADRNGRKIGRSTRLNSSHSCAPRMPSTA